jgi:hypothetical protein
MTNLNHTGSSPTGGTGDPGTPVLLVGPAHQLASSPGSGNRSLVIPVSPDHRLPGSHEHTGLRDQLESEDTLHSGGPYTLESGTTGSTGVPVHGSTLDPGLRLPLDPGLWTPSPSVTGSTGPLVVPEFAVPSDSGLTGDREEYASALGDLYMDEFLAWGLDPFWMLTIRPPRNWAVPWIGQAIKEAAVQYHRITYAKRNQPNDDFSYYAAIVYSHKKHFWHAHLLCQRLPLFPDRLVRCFEKEFGHRSGIVDLKDREDFRAEVAGYPGWQDEAQSSLDYREYVAGPRNIQGHYFYDTFGTLEPHVDVYGSVLRRNPESVQRARAAAELVLQHGPKVTARQEPQTGGPCAAGNGADRIDENIADVDAIPTDSGTQSAAGEPGGELPALGRHTLAGLRLEEQEALECRSWRYRIIKFAHTFRDAQGRRYRWYGTNPRPVNLRGYRFPGRYPVLRGVPLTFAANIREIWPDGTVSISRPYLRLDRQPEATRHIYAEECGIPLDELNLVEQ